jgi:cell wall-associated NlpC family hydrolase
MHPWADKYVGIEFEEKGRNRDGCDCWGLVRLVLKEQFDVDLMDHNDDYRSVKDRHAIARVVENDLSNWIETEKPQCGDVVLLRSKGLPLHIGVMVNKRKMLHIEKGINAGTERLDSITWKDRVIGYYRSREMNHVT